MPSLSETAIAAENMSLSMSVSMHRSKSELAMSQEDECRSHGNSHSHHNHDELLSWGEVLGGGSSHANLNNLDCYSDLCLEDGGNHGHHKPMSVESDEERLIHMLLIVAESPIIRKLHAQVLSQYVCHFAEAEDGGEAVSMVRESLYPAEEQWLRNFKNESPAGTGTDTEMLPTYDVVLIDYQLRQMNGPSAVRAIRALGYDGLIIGEVPREFADIDSECFITSGADAVMIKPFRPKEFLQLLNGKIDWCFISLNDVVMGTWFLLATAALL